MASTKELDSESYEWYSDVQYWSNGDEIEWISYTIYDDSWETLDRHVVSFLKTAIPGIFAKHCDEECRALVINTCFPSTINFYPEPSGYAHVEEGVICYELDVRLAKTICDDKSKSDEEYQEAWKRVWDRVVYCLRTPDIQELLWKRHDQYPFRILTFDEEGENVEEPDITDQIMIPQA